VSLRDGPLGEIKAPVIWLAGAALVVAIGAAIALFVMGAPRGSAFDSVRRTADSVAAPVGGVLETPIRVAGDGVGAVRAYFLAGSQNRELRADLAAALTWRDETLKLRQENARLRALLGVRTAPPLPMVAANTVLDARGPFSNSRLADAGANQGVAEGNPVLSEQGLVGRIAGVGPQVSRIMLLTDVESRTPVMIPRTNGRAILTGDGGPRPGLDYLRTHDPLVVGDRVLSSGDGGVVPRGLAVGTVAKGLDGSWRVVLDSDAAPLDFVRILLFTDFTQLTKPEELTPNVMPATNTDAPEAPAIIASGKTPSKQTVPPPPAKAKAP
jgi:rod shape-determining protein MreC